MGTEILYMLRFAAYFIVFCSAVIGFTAAYLKYSTWKKRKQLAQDELSARFLRQFNDKEIDRALAGYVVPHCSPSDPSNREGEEFLADTRESIFSYMDRNIEAVSKSYHLLLADTGMGKTSFCLNYYAHCRNKFQKYNVCLVSLAATNADSIIKSVANKSETILLADAFDEDTKGFGRGRDRLSDILESAADFRMVVITCRSQYFVADDAIPRETPLPVLVPRQLGQSPTFSLIRSYISPFSKDEIQRYIQKHFPILYFWRLPSRRRARELVESVPDLAYRPMLLERLPELAKRRAKSTELYDLYDLLIEGWLSRESRWIGIDDLRSISLELALQMYSQLQSRRGRMSVDEIRAVATDKIGSSPDWTHLTARSLLNRDSRGLYKFAHKSILEFLVVKMACEGDDRALRVRWTPFMKELFVSWGHANHGVNAVGRARDILQSEMARTNITPLCDMLGTTAVAGFPNFKRCAEGKFASTGERLAPAAWRATTIGVYNERGRGIVTIADPEYNLTWSYLPSRDEGDGVPVRLVDALNFSATKAGYRLPSFEQFVTLVEGLYRAGNEVIPDGVMFLLEDKPGRYLHLLAQINSDIVANGFVKCVDKQRRIHNTQVYVNCYVTGMPYAPDYANRVKVDQLYIQEDLGDLL